MSPHRVRGRASGSDELCLFLLRVDPSVSDDRLGRSSGPAKTKMDVNCPDE